MNRKSSKKFLLIFTFLGQGLLFLFPRLRGMVDHTGRQRFLLGVIMPGRNAHDLISYLVEQQGFENHYLCWVDPGQIASLRLIDPRDVRYQYHLRLFKDREVRGHYEKTLRRHPWHHLLEIGMEPRREQFLQFLGDWVIPSASPRS